MFQFRTLNDRVDDMTTGAGEFSAENPQENFEDSMEILGDQDATAMTGLPDVEDEKLGGMGTSDDFGLSSNEFARGEIDVAEQIARTTAAQEKAGGRLDGDLTHVPHKTINNDDAALKPDSKGTFKPAHHGHETGAYTDIGAGRSGVTREH